VIRLIAGLKNPGSEYAKTRHNAGAWFTDALAHEQQLHFKFERKFYLELAELSQPDGKVLVIKPVTYMNESGVAVAAFAKFYQIKPEEILVVHDELDLAPGVARLKKGGGHGGHNGLRDIESRLGSKDFYRLRIGIGHPGHKDRVVGYVLQNPRTEEKIEIEHSIDQALAVMPDVLSGEIERAMKALHTIG